MQGRTKKIIKLTWLYSMYGMSMSASLIVLMGGRWTIDIPSTSTSTQSGARRATGGVMATHVDGDASTTTMPPIAGVAGGAPSIIRE